VSQNKSILILSRSDSAEKYGGDLFLLHSFKKILVNSGYNVKDECDCLCSLDGIDAVFAINLDRPFENYIMLQRCQKKNIKFFIYTLHHPINGIEKYLSSEYLSGIRGVVSFLSCRNFFAYESLVSLLRLVSSNKFSYYLYSFGVISKYSMKALLNKSTCLLVANELEKEAIENELSVVVERYEILPHIYDPHKTYKSMPVKKDRLIVCAGRIEPRKNQLGLLDVVSDLEEYEFVFVGGSNPTAKSYHDVFTNRADKLKNVTVIDFMPLEDLRLLLENAEVFISLSYFEVVSLTELEAYSLFCKMVLTENSYIKEHISGSSVKYVDPGDYDKIVKSIKALSEHELDFEERKSIVYGPKIKDLSLNSVSERLNRVMLEYL